MYKRALAGNKLILISFILLIVVVGVGIVAGISFFFNTSYDFREIEANILNFKVVQCLTEKNVDPSSEEFFSECGLNEEAIKRDHLIVITSGEETLLSVGKGDRTQCSLQDKNIEFPRCKTTFIGDLKIITGSSQNSRGKLI